MVIIADDDDTAKGLNKIAARNTGTNGYKARFSWYPSRQVYGFINKEAVINFILPTGCLFFK